jgi:DNA-binding NtrC family response regulator
MNCENETIKVLLLEDDGVDADSIKRLVHNEGLNYEVTVVETCAETLAILKVKDFDIALLDSCVPDGSGLDLLAEMKNIPAIIITGKGDVESAVRALKLGASDFLIKDIAGMYLHLLPHVVKESLEQKKLFLDKVEIEKERDRLRVELKKIKTQLLSSTEMS